MRKLNVVNNCNVLILKAVGVVMTVHLTMGIISVISMIQCGDPFF